MSAKNRDMKQKKKETAVAAPARHEARSRWNNRNANRGWVSSTRVHSDGSRFASEAEGRREHRDHDSSQPVRPTRHDCSSMGKALLRAERANRVCCTGSRRPGDARRIREGKTMRTVMRT